MHQLEVYAAVDGRPLGSVPIRVAAALAISDADTAIGHSRIEASVFSTSSMRALATLACLYGGSISATAIAANGRFAVAICPDGGAKRGLSIWTAGAEPRFATLAINDRGVAAAELADDGTLVIAGLDDLRRLVPETPVRVVVTRVRRSVLGRAPQAQIQEALRVHAGFTEVTCIPDDRAAFDLCLREGRTLAEVAPKSPARGVLREFARACGTPVAARTGVAA